MIRLTWKKSTLLSVGYLSNDQEAMDKINLLDLLPMKIHSEMDLKIIINAGSVSNGEI